ncbi:MAG: hypothetical protein Q27BPR15_19060 [Rhodobacter sp. CACIA14H1]|nr:MAG: hypothetical protein Q27BPR15_19060 [Rhodobacter sp. CACIA14H1]
MVPAWTKPAQLNSTSTAPICAAIARTAAPSVTSRRCASIPSARSASTALVLMSVAMTRAPSALKARTVASPIPAPEAVQKAVFP